MILPSFQKGMYCKMYKKSPFIVGVDYTELFFNNAFRLSTFIFFSFTFDVVITKPKKFFKNIEIKKIPGLLLSAVVSGSF